MRFDDLEMDSSFLEKTRENGFEQLTNIQEKCIHEISRGRDVVGQAETGSGKTLAFGLPILNKIEPGAGVQAIVLTPTRELCVQVTDVFQEFGKRRGIKTTGIYGGVSIGPQIKNIRTSDIIVGTPGRILDHIGRHTIHLNAIQFVVLDETDRMLDMGFIDDVDKIIRHTPKDRQTLMFSATIHGEFQQRMGRYLMSPLVVKTQPYVSAHKLEETYYDISPKNLKFSLLVHLLKDSAAGSTLVFCNTRRETDIVARNLRKQNINAVALHGGMTQPARLKSLNALKNRKTDVLVATDVAARGLDIKKVTHVFNYDVPKTTKEYVHRIGRTARAGETGVAVTLMTQHDHDSFRRIQKEYEHKITRADMPTVKQVPFHRASPKKQRTSSPRYAKKHNRRHGAPHRNTYKKSKKRHRRR
ncbi:MAG: DEAD/DEAH box helicase [Thermoplasmatota archaeon]